MSRPIRIEFPGAVYHVTSRGNRRQPVFTEKSDFELFYQVLGEALKKHRALCHTCCLMNNHYHLLLETGEANLSQLMRHLNGVYTQTFNSRHDKCGHVFQGRYKAVLIEKSAHLMEACRYVVLNPVRAGLAGSPSDWHWSSYRRMIGVDTDPEFVTMDWVLAQFADDVEKARRLYAEFVAEGVQKKCWPELGTGVALGSAGFIDKCKSLAGGKGNAGEIPKYQRRAVRPALAEILGAHGERVIKWLAAVDEYGYSQKELALQEGLHYSYVSRVLKLERSKVKT